MIEVNPVLDNRLHASKQLDQDKSGGIAFSKLLAAFDKTGKGGKVLENYNRNDKDHNGELDGGEMKNLRAHIRKQLFDKVDKNDSEGWDPREIQALTDGGAIMGG